jgi:AcrR family transcriptional regulator
MPRYKETERERATGETRRLLLEAAAHEFARRGYDVAKVDDISKSAGFAKGTIYNYFPSKRALMLELIRETAQMHFEMIAAIVLQEANAIRRLERFFEAGWSFVVDHLHQGRVLVNTLYGSDMEFKQALWQAYQPMFELVNKDIIEQGLAKGLFRDVDALTTARLIMNLYLAVASQADDHGRIWIDAKQVSDFVFHALGKRGS